MTKLLKILGNILHITIEILVILLIVFLFFIRTSRFQTYLAHKATHFISNKFGVDASIKKVDIAFFDRIYLDNVFLADKHQDTLLYVHELYVNYDINMLGWPTLHIDKVSLSGVNAKLKKYKNEDHLNLQFLLDAFHSDQSSSPKFTIDIGDVEVVDARFIYENQHTKKIPFGVDYDHISVKSMNLDARNVVLTPTKYGADIEALSLNEQSGLQLEKLKGEAQFDQHGLIVNKLSIKTSRSTAHLANFQLKMNRPSDFTSYIDSVQMISSIQPSTVSMIDISYFAPVLEGMKEMVTVSGATRETVKDFQMNNIVLKYGKGSVVKGNFSLPDFRRLSKENIHQKANYICLLPEDLKHFSLPDNGKSFYIPWPESLDGIKKVVGKNVRLNGKLHNLNIQLDELTTNLGSVQFHNPFRLTSDSTFSQLKLVPIGQAKNQIALTDFKLNSIIHTNTVGRLKGNLSFRALKVENHKITLSDVSGILKDLSVYGYAYDYVNLDELNYTIDNSGRVAENTIDGSFFVRDENLDLSFKGKASIGSHLKIDSKINLECANLSALNPALKNRGDLVSSVYVNAEGSNLDHFKGRVLVDSVHYTEDGKTFTTTDFNGYMAKNNKKDSIWIQSKLLDANAYGNINFSEITENITYQLSKLFKIAPTKRKEKLKFTNNYFNYDINVKEINPFLAIVLPKLAIANHTKIKGEYKANSNYIQLNLNSNYIAYDSLRFENIAMNQEVSQGELLGVIDVSKAKINDSLSFRSVHFTGLAQDGVLDSQLLFEGMDNQQSNVQWLTHFYSDSLIKLNFLHSFLSLKNKKWALKDGATIVYKDKAFIVKGFELENDNQFIAANGKISDSTKDKLYIDLMGFDLHEIGLLAGAKRNFSGTANVTGYITSPFTHFQFLGESIIKNLKVNNSSVGNVSFGMKYGSNGNRMNMYGDIYYRKEHTFHFDGYYLTKAKSKMDNRLNFNMHFNSTNIGVVNEFLDPDVIKDFKGKLTGDIALTGTIDKPVVNGGLTIKQGMVNLAILGADFYFDGKLKLDKKGIYIQQMPLRDEEGNVGFVTGNLTHDYFHDLKYQIVVNVEDNPMKDFPGYFASLPTSNRFLVMHTKYALDKPYYGDAYISGIAKISGTSDDLKINVDATTDRGTKLFIPMYGPTKIENDGFITFKKANDTTNNTNKIDLTGVDLRLHFNVTDDAQVKLIFDKNSGDAISGIGHGNVTLSVNQMNQLQMEGTYTVNEGFYNFSLGPYKQKFTIKPGGTVQWSGSPYDANLDLHAYYKTRANLAVVMPDVIDNTTSTNQEIYANMKITGQLTNPTLDYDLRAPQASESGKAILARIRSEKDELNRQFFSILITKSFLPLAGRVGQGGGSTNALLDLASSQINSILNKVTDGYQMNVNLDNDQYSGEFSGEVGISKSFLNNRLIVSGSFGIGSVKDKTAVTNTVNQNRFIGDVRLEYLLNKSGTFRLNVFNKSNDYSILQNEGRGNFTQGIGVIYKEDFYSIRDFQLIQSMINLFRSQENEVHTKKDSGKVPIPDQYLDKKSEK